MINFGFGLNFELGSVDIARHHHGHCGHALLSNTHKLISLHQGVHALKSRFLYFSVDC